MMDEIGVFTKATLLLDSKHLQVAQAAEGIHKLLDKHGDMDIDEDGGGVEMDEQVELTVSQFNF